MPGDCFPLVVDRPLGEEHRASSDGGTRNDAAQGRRSRMAPTNASQPGDGVDGFHIERAHFAERTDVVTALPELLDHGLVADG